MAHHNLRDNTYRLSTRRGFLRQGVAVAAAASVAATVDVPAVHAGEDNTIRLAFIGCGPRGSGAIANALSAPGGPVKLVAMADIVADRVENAHRALSKEFGDKVDVPPERRFLGFDAYRKAIDCLRPGDVAVLTTRAAFRPTHFDYAAAKGMNIFMEKSFSPDPGGIHRMLQSNQIAQQKKLKVAAGLQCRHSTARQEMVAKIRAGEMGELLLIRAYRMQPAGSAVPPRNNDSELIRQVRAGGAFLWTSGGTWMENMIHQVDECCWLKDAWPVEVQGLGGRVPGSQEATQNFDTYTMEYTFADGAKALVFGRFIPNCFNEFATFVHGTKRAGQFSGNIHASTCRYFEDQRIASDRIAWKAGKESTNLWQAEWNVFLAAIRADRPHNETQRACMSNLAAIMGRAAVHSGQTIAWKDAMQSRFRFCDSIDTMNDNTPPPVMPDDQGRFPAPLPGQWKEI